MSHHFSSRQNYVFSFSFHVASYSFRPSFHPAACRSPRWGLHCDAHVLPIANHEGIMVIAFTLLSSFDNPSSMLLEILFPD
jgi:hypothetical protein